MAYVTRQDYDLMQAAIALIDQKDQSSLQHVLDLIDQGARWDVDIEQKFYISNKEINNYLPTHHATVPLTSLEAMLVGAPMFMLCDILKNIGPLPDVSYNNLFRIQDVLGDYKHANNKFGDFKLSSPKYNHFIEVLGFWSHSRMYNRNHMNNYTSFWAVLAARNDVMIQDLSALIDIAKTLNKQPKMTLDEFQKLTQSRDETTPLNMLMLIAIGLEDNAKNSSMCHQYIQKYIQKDKATNLEGLLLHIEERLTLEALNLSSDKSSPTKKM